MPKTVKRLRNHLRYVCTANRGDPQRRAEGKEMVDIWNELPEELALVVATRFTEKVGKKEIGLPWLQETLGQKKKRGAAGAELD